MPRWARFLSCTLTGLLLSLSGFLLGAYWWEGGSRFWPALLNFVPTPGFLYLVSLFALLAATSLLLARIAVRLYGASGVIAGLLMGGLVAIAYTAFLLAIYAEQWGGWSMSLQKSWPIVGLVATPFALSGAYMVWLWERLDH